MGYGFADFHLNKLFPFIRYDQQKARKVVVLGYADDNEDGVVHRQDDWTYHLFETIPANAHDIGLRLPPIVKYYKDAYDFERSSDPKLPLALWYNGLLAACDHPQKFINELL
jgi:hypothetical protein